MQIGRSIVFVFCSPVKRLPDPQGGDAGQTRKLIKPETGVNLKKLLRFLAKRHQDKKLGETKDVSDHQ